MLNITKIPCRNCGDRGFFKPEIIVVHISTGTMASMDSWFAQPVSQASAHYAVGKDGTTVHQYVEEGLAAWANGRVINPSFKLYKWGINPNKYTISIENEGTDLSIAPDVQINLLLELIRDVARRWSIPLDRDHIIGHYQVDAVNRPFCPSPDHAVMDRLVARLQTEEMVSVQVPKSKEQQVRNFIRSIT